MSRAEQYAFLAAARLDRRPYGEHVADMGRERPMQLPPGYNRAG